MTWIDNTVVTVVVIVGVFLLYQGMKEPLDLLFGHIRNGAIALKDLIVGNEDGGNSQVTEISYG